MENLNKENYKEKFKKIHGEKFIYNMVEYKNNSTKVKIICPVHGEFTQAPKDHYKGQGCAKCFKDTLKSSREEFIKKAMKKHDIKYNYDNVNYINSRTKVKIICYIHGEFEIQANNHLNGQGCRKCAGKSVTNTDEFILKAEKIYAGKYKYNNVIYLNSNSKINIICSKHGEFTQRASSHLNGNGCPKCHSNSLCDNDKFIEKAKLKHNNIYDYSLTEYKGSLQKIEIICKKHGQFLQLAQGHLCGNGCPRCKRSKGENLIEIFLIENNINYKQQYTFSDLKYKKMLQYDFGIIDNFGNLKSLIEYNGEQHYKYNEFMFKTQEDFKISQAKFQMKFDYCKKNNIPLFIIKYNENINLKLNEIFNI